MTAFRSPMMPGRAVSCARRRARVKRASVHLGPSVGGTGRRFSKGQRAQALRWAAQLRLMVRTPAPYSGS
jgi:hypothetical protein